MGAEMGASLPRDSTLKPIITDEITDDPTQATGKDFKGRFTKANPFGGSRPNAGRKPMPEARKRALESFHDGLPEAVAYLRECLHSENPDDRKWACELMIRKGIPNIEALLVHGHLETKPDSVFNSPPMSKEAWEAIKQIAEKECQIVEAALV
jgi:hypothetical protein